MTARPPMQLCCGLRWRSSISPESQGLYGCTRGVDFAQQYKRVALIGPQNQVYCAISLLAKMDQKTIKEISNRAGINCDEGEFVGYQDSVQSGLNLFVSISIEIVCEKANKNIYNSFNIIEDYGYGVEDELLSLNKESSILKLTTGGFTSALDPTRVTQISWSPRAFLYRGFLTDKECDHLITLLRQEKIAERIRALQELVPSVNKTDRAAKLDEIVDYVKFLRLQVKVRAWIEELYPGISNHIVSYIIGLDSLKATSIGDILPKPNEGIRLRMDDL
ncbi:hypothetical protein BUALT_Bualt17G0068500 [Buddleja alternifolia]|uniref:BHLH domain-containing protein n=1 Tax=Buddleja alternifolia TaxID=168488 RepID=A0AAV6W6P2_9LAMI|nr:hypothetical protein BUALT_Bualt17G0068500 [Buddleja alternifolia]